MRVWKTGFRGRTIISEALEVTEEIGAALNHGAIPDEIKLLAIKQGMTTMADDGIRRALDGETTIAEVRRVLSLR